MNGFALFTDVSLDPQRKVGVGGYLLVPAQFLERNPQDIEQREVYSALKTKSFAETSSTKLEVQTVLWALECSLGELVASAGGELRIYTDSQCVARAFAQKSGLGKQRFRGEKIRPAVAAGLTLSSVLRSI